MTLSSLWRSIRQVDFRENDFPPTDTDRLPPRDGSSTFSFALDDLREFFAGAVRPAGG